MWNDARNVVWSRCESPIEQLLCNALFHCCGCIAVSGAFTPARLSELAEIAGDTPACFLFPQHPVGAYRLDFLLVAVDPQRRTMRRLGIECDGKLYHSAPAQVARDERRDEQLRQAGYNVLRFTGTEIHRGLHDVVRAIFNWLALSGVEQRACNENFWACVECMHGWLFSPSDAERQGRRDEYWEEIRQEQQLSDFVCDDGSPGRWADTL